MSKPRALEGKNAISAYFKVESGAEGNCLAFSKAVPTDGTKVFCSAVVEVKGGKIARQTVV